MRHMVGTIKKTRKSIFKELGLDCDLSTHGPSRPSPPVVRDEPSMPLPSDKALGDDVPGLFAGAGTRDRIDSTAKPDGDEYEHAPAQAPAPAPPQRADTQQPERPQRRPTWVSKVASAYRRSRTEPAPNPGTAAAPATSTKRRFALIAVLAAVVLPSSRHQNARDMAEMAGAADAGIIRRADSPVDVCLRWSHQAAILNGTVYIYGGQARSTADQTTFTWNNNFLTLDLTKSWGTNSPSLTGLPIPDGPPAVANGYLWHDYNNLYLYGGLFADNMGGTNKYATPAPVSLWRYSVSDEAWTEFPDPLTSAGWYAEPGGVPIQRSAEGAGLSVPELGLSWYFGGHLDWATTPGWSTQTPRIYLKSLLEWTHPGYMNAAVDDLVAAGASEGGAYRNITQGGIQDDAGFSERADGVLVFVPGWGEMGVLLGMSGGTNSTFTRDLSTLDVYDIKNSEWYHQKTTGDVPSVRVNACAVIASAPDASSFQVYFYGGQNLQPYAEQIQYNDMYILTIPSFTWIRVDTADNAPAGRAGHTCTMRDGQMVVIGGYLGQEKICESPGVLVFDATNLVWTSKFTAGDHAPDLDPDNSVLAGSYGYKVPRPVQEVVGGNEDGGATVTQPAAGSATSGPFATGKPPVFTVTAGAPGATFIASPDDTDSGPSPGLIAACTIAGLLGLLAVYLGFCAWLYRRQVAVYKRHVAIAGRSSSALGSATGVKGYLRRVSGLRRDSVASDEWFGWVGAGGHQQPGWTSDQAMGSLQVSSGSMSRVASGSAAESAIAGGSGSGSVLQWKKEYAQVPGERPGERPGDADQHSIASAEHMLDGHEPSFFSVVMAPRRALRVVNSTD